MPTSSGKCGFKGGCRIVGDHFVHWHGSVPWKEHYMNRVVRSIWFATFVCGAAGVSFGQTSTPGTSGSMQAIKRTMTCAEFMSLLKAKESQTVGFAIQWLDGIYSG